MKGLNLKSLLFFISLVQFSFSYKCTEAETIRDGISFKYSFHCEEQACECGQFVTGDFWVVPKSSGGVVSITEITPLGEANGAMSNPDLIKEASSEDGFAEEQVQGIVMGYDHYDPQLNLMTQLPYEARGGESIMKVKTQTSGCGTKAIEIGCVASAAVLTVLSEIPENQGKTFFRPPFHGDWKPLLSSEKVLLERLPRLENIGFKPSSTIQGPFGFEEWLVPQYDLNHQGGFSGEFHRASIPHLAHTPYAADQALNFLEDLASLFGTQSLDDKKMGVYSLIQRGIDIYGIFKMNIRFGSGAGQHLGRKPPLAFFAAMYDDVDILNEIRNLATDPFYETRSYFQEDSQIRAGKSGMPIWGSKGQEKLNHWYWSRLYPRLDTNGDSGDPDGWIDGPAGGVHPDPDQTRDRNYMSVAGGPLISYAFLQHLMPWFKYAAGDPEILKWSDRIYKGYGVENFDGGLWTKPDPCAPVPEVDLSTCSPYRMYSTKITDCQEYQISWGPNTNAEQSCFEHGGDPMTDGRMPELHGTKIAFNRLSYAVLKNWDEFRECADPSNSSYPCEGLGEEVDIDVETTLLKIQTDFEMTFIYNKKAAYVILVFDQRGKLQFNTMVYKNEIDFKRLNLKAGLYFYKIKELMNGVVNSSNSGRFIVLE